MRRIELLYFDGCPGYEALLARLTELVGDRGKIELRHITSPEQAHAERFLGSPSLRVDGEDVEPAARERTDYEIKCRLYPTNRGRAHAPPEEWIRRAIER